MTFLLFLMDTNIATLQKCYTPSNFHAIFVLFLYFPVGKMKLRIYCRLMFLVFPQQNKCLHSILFPGLGKHGPTSGNEDGPWTEKAFFRNVSCAPFQLSKLFQSRHRNAIPKTGICIIYINCIQS